MSAPNLPADVIAMLASPEMRTHHAVWHFVRNRWHALSNAERQSYRAEGWEPPRLNPLQRPGDTTPAPPRDEGSGLDFLFMHRQMIAHVNHALDEADDPDYQQVDGWSPIPWDHNDADWPMPPIYRPDVANAKAQSVTDLYRNQVEEMFENDDWLSQQTLNEVGAIIEDGIHNWMHMHWSAAPWFTGAPGQNRDDIRNDFLGSTYSSHVNKTFWKLHGWIDSRIEQWQQATGETADFSDSWEGPSVHDHRLARRRLSLPEAEHADGALIWAFERSLAARRQPLK